jgi:transposase
MTTLADHLLPDQLWQRVQPLLPAPPSHARGGAPRTVPDRACMAAIVFMARTSTPWALLPVGEFGCGSVTTCWRRFAEWAHAGVFERLHEVLLDELGEAGALDWSRVCVDSFALRPVRGDQVGANPVDRGKPGCKLHLAADGGGLPLSLLATLPCLPASAWDRSADRPAQDRVLHAAGPPPLEGGTHDRLAGRVPAAADPLRPGLRAVLRLRRAGLRPAVLQPPARHHPAPRAVAVTNRPEGQNLLAGSGVTLLVGRGQTAAPPG